MNCALTALAFGLVCVFTAAQPGPVMNLSQSADTAAAMPKTHAVAHQISSKSRRYSRTATALRTIADSIKTCPRIIEFDGSKDKEEPEGPLAEARLYYGPPTNVTWAESFSSTRSTDEGYVQFSLPRELLLPVGVRSQWANEIAAVLSGMSEDMPPLEYRYKFYVGRNRVRLTEILVRTAHQSEWRKAPEREKACSPFGCAPVCWQSGPQTRQILSQLQRSMKAPSPR